MMKKYILIIHMMKKYILIVLSEITVAVLSEIRK